MRNRSNLQFNSPQIRTLVPRCPPDGTGGVPTVNPRARMTVDEIARRLDIGRVAVYAMLEQGIIPAVRLGRRWIVMSGGGPVHDGQPGMPGVFPAGAALSAPGRQRHARAHSVSGM